MEYPTWFVIVAMIIIFKSILGGLYLVFLIAIEMLKEKNE